MDRLSAQPGIESVGLGNALPGSENWAAAAYTVEGVPASAWRLQFAPFATVDGGYFQALGIPLLDGRRFDADDRPDSVPVVIVNRSMAEHLWPGQRAIGKRLHVGNPQKPYPWATVVGIVADIKRGGRDQPSGDQWYIPSRQPATLFGPNEPLTIAAGGYIVLRSALPPEQMEGVLRSTVTAVDPQLALEDVQTMEDVIANVEAPRRFNTGLITSFALGGLLLAVTGIYAVVAFSVSLRTQEIGIRVALGAQRSGIARMILVAAARLALVGCALGVVGSLAASRMLSALLFQVSAADPWIYLGGASLMMLMALAASALPARRAASADPLDAIRAS
jgi:putative ABC transport system permease protein